ncbi:MarR family winged helix-turn-helix transcriptional regulator [Aquiflexum gelatinilyticum]|uniref:MarR family transcriptional regulator n=1 Tax=Aquiflexum gelatinilyticum TaxID=2961943 RepID=A0A9X2T0A9_9BACT|nr:MarR family transcriptional regulator [Aquiflexum gelatinilyticum]MCR9013685.1 MarR family transcriptional regulator [Aquiflexum gelatinilyticum]MCS4433587.1 MarR family transcriptional regulator [Aquiflexum gelatinilyticum]
MDQLKLDNQICFPVYAASRLIIREYQPHLDKLGITYPQYLVLLVLWEEDGISVNDIAHKLILNTNTVTPLLKRMETLGLVSRIRSEEDERRVILTLTAKGSAMKSEAAHIPFSLMADISPDALKMEELVAMKIKLEEWIGFLKKKSEKEL